MRPTLFAAPRRLASPLLTAHRTSPRARASRSADNEDGRYGYRKPIPGAWCVPILLAPSTSTEVMDLMGTVASRNGFASPVLYGDMPEGSLVEDNDAYPTVCSGEVGSGCILAFETVPLLKAWLNANQGRAGAAVIFGDTLEGTDPEGNPTIEQVPRPADTSPPLPAPRPTPRPAREAHSARWRHP